MTLAITHAKVSLKADGVETSQVQPSDWNDDHRLSGGSDGDVLVRDSGETDGAAWVSELALVAPTPSGIFTKNATNPVLANAVEVSLVMDGDQCDAWYRNINDSKIYYAYSTDAANAVWTVGNGGVAISTTSTDLGGAIFPYVFKVGSTYYMAAKLGGGDLYLFSSTDKVTWAIANSSAPILTHSATLSSPIHAIFNPAIAVVGTTWHLLIEGQTSTSDFQTSYSYATFSGSMSFNTNISATSVLPTKYDATIGTGNPFLLYVPDRSALLAIYGDRSGSGSINVLRAASIPIASNPAVPGNWTLAPAFAIETPGVHLTDPTLAFTTSATKTWKVLLHYNYNQLQGYAATGQLTIDEFYDAVTDDGRALDLTGAARVNAGELGTTTTAGLELINNAPATAAQQQYAPGIDLVGEGWSTAAGGASMEVRTRWELRPVQGASAPTFLFVLKGSVNGSTWTDLLTCDSAGNVVFLGTLSVGNVVAGSLTSGSGKVVSSGGDLNISASGYLYWTGRGSLNSPANGQFNLTNNAATVGVGVDVTTDGTIVIRNRALNADGQIAGASVRGNAVTFANRPATPVEGMTVAFTDSTTVVWGATITGSGSNHVLGYYNGTNWTVIGK